MICVECARQLAPRPWYYEAGQGQLFNEWTPAHFAWGIAAWIVFGRLWPGLTLHTAYELLEDFLYPPEGRDRSVVNNLGDTIAFLAGQLLTAWGFAAVA